MKKLLAVLVLLLLGIFVVSYSWAGEVRVWTSGESTVEGEFIELVESGTIVRIRKTNGKVVRIPLVELSQEDMAYVKKKQSPFEEEESPFVEEDDTSSMLQAGTRKVLPADGIEYAFRWCPPGEFTMGTPESEWPDFFKKLSYEYDSDYAYDEWDHKVTLSQGFWLLETEVTQEMWRSVMGENPSGFKGDKNPVESVNWNDCQEFCKKLSAKLGQRVQLPTEAQWEYACRAGTTGDYAGILDEMAWYGENSGSTTHAVGQKTPNAWGLYDMHGNVDEWCSDWYDKNYYLNSPKIDPTGPNSGPGRVCRGSDWACGEVYCRSAERGYRNPFRKTKATGLRFLLVPGQE